MTRFLNISTDNTLGSSSPSNELVSSQKAVKDYVDGKVPTVNNPTITITQGGVTKGSFTLNQASGDTIALDAGGGGSVAVDGITITRNTSQEIQAVATVNANTAAGATNPICDWNGTLAEYKDQEVATNHPDWMCYITDDFNDEGVVFSKEVAERNIGEVVYSTVPITDAGLHLANGELLDGTGIYKDFYDYMVGVYNNGHTSIFCSEADWQAEIADHDRCGKYVLDTVNKTIRLPNIYGHLYAARDENLLGTYIAPGLPNITGNTHWIGAVFNNNNSSYANGVFSSYDSNNGAYAGGGGYSNAAARLSFDASRSSSIYGASSTVETAAVRVFIYIVIANTIKTPIEVDIDQVATDLNNISAKTTDMYAHRLVASQAPTSSNNYTWYRKYSDGWVEQGQKSVNIAHNSYGLFTLPVAMADTNYSSHAGCCQVSSSGTFGAASTVAANAWTTTQVRLGQSNGASASMTIWWEVKGMAA